jgi:hypothetical protein
VRNHKKNRTAKVQTEPLKGEGKVGNFVFAALAFLNLAATLFKWCFGDVHTEPR